MVSNAECVAEIFAYACRGATGDDGSKKYGVVKLADSKF